MHGSKVRKPTPDILGRGPQNVVAATNIKTICERFDTAEHTTERLNIQAALRLQQRFQMPMHTAKVVAALAGLGGAHG